MIKNMQSGIQNLVVGAAILLSASSAQSGNIKGAYDAARHPELTDLCKPAFQFYQSSITDENPHSPLLFNIDTKDMLNAMPSVHSYKFVRTIEREPEILTHFFKRPDSKMQWDYAIMEGPYGTSYAFLKNGDYVVIPKWKLSLLRQHDILIKFDDGNGIKYSTGHFDEERLNVVSATLRCDTEARRAYDWEFENRKVIKGTNPAKHNPKNK